MFFKFGNFENKKYFQKKNIRSQDKNYKHTVELENHDEFSKSIV